MNKLETFCDSTARVITQTIKKKLMPQYRTVRLGGIEDTVEKELLNLGQNIFDYSYGMAKTEIANELEEKYNGYIPAPKTHFKARWKFFWTGKLK